MNAAASKTVMGATPSGVQIPSSPPDKPNIRKALKMKMIYPKNFIKRVKKVYPNERKLHNYLEQGDIIAGRILDNMSYTTNINKEKDNLYKEWLKFRSHNKPVTKEFVEKVKKIYPSFPELYEYVETGNYIAEIYLEYLRHNAPKQNDEKVALFLEWLNMYKRLLKETGLSK